MIPSLRITATPKLLLPLNNKLLGRKIKHTMSNSLQSRPRLCSLTRKIVHWCREECDNHDSSWQFVTCDDGPVTHHPPPACWQTIQSRTSNLTSRLTRVFMWVAVHCYPFTPPRHIGQYQSGSMLHRDQYHHSHKTQFSYKCSNCINSFCV